MATAREAQILLASFLLSLLSQVLILTTPNTLSRLISPSESASWGAGQAMLSTAVRDVCFSHPSHTTWMPVGDQIYI